MISDVVLIILLLNIYFSSINNLVGVNLNLRDLKGVLDFRKNEIENNLEVNHGEKIKTISNVKLEIPEVKIGDTILLTDINLEAKKGDVVGIIGPSGSGKSTLVKYLLKFREIDTVTINNIDIRKYSNDEVRSKISYYSQNILIISMSVFENITLGKSYSLDDLEVLKQYSFFQKIF